MERMETRIKTIEACKYMDTILEEDEQELLQCDSEDRSGNKKGRKQKESNCSM